MLHCSFPLQIGDIKLSQREFSRIWMSFFVMFVFIISPPNLFCMACFQHAMRKQAVIILCVAVFMNSEDYEQLVEDIVRDGRLYASENHQEILKVSSAPFSFSSSC